MIQINLLGYDFENKLRDGIDRYSYELYINLLKIKSKKDKINTFSYSNLYSKFNIMPNSISSQFIETFIINFYFNNKLTGNIVHLMSPDKKMPITKAVKLITWHDTMGFKRRLELAANFKEKLKAKIKKSWAIHNWNTMDFGLYNSSLTKREVELYMLDLDLQQRPGAVINFGLNNKFIKKQIYKQERKDFVYVGSIEQEHKNLDALIQSIINIRNIIKEAKLYIYSNTSLEKLRINNKFFYKGIREKYIIYNAKKTDDEIINKLSKSIALLHLSKKEGFGFPILESIAIGTPVIVLKESEIPEETKKYAIKTNFESIPNIALKLYNHQKPVSQEAIKYAKSFTWEKTAMKTYELYKKLSE
ncbi:MAG: glycosyltransferase [Candidatus Marsarchaeota archaeon]|nr:glycosyltransferase [Candidatus Marsarchaeota archaeon]MCL5094992.1 glycosyltransferase [Candidatus Marsarchaeota archaeon]